MSVARKSAVLIAAIVALIVTLIVCFMCLGYVRASQYYLRNTFVQHPRVLLSGIHDELKTGDVLLFVGSAHNLMTSMLTQVLYSHAGMIVSRNGKLYMSESTVVEPYMSDPERGVRAYTRHGTNLIPLLDRVGNYCGQVFVMPLNGKLSAADEDNAWRAATASYPYPSTKQAFMGLAGIRTSSRHCFQHAGHMIDVLGLKLKGKKPFSEMGIVEVVLEIVNLPGKDLGRGYAYLPAQNIQFDGLPRSAEFERSGSTDIEPRPRETAKPNPSQYRIDVRSSIELFDNRRDDERRAAAEVSAGRDPPPESQQDGEGQDSVPRHMVEMGAPCSEADGHPGLETLRAGCGDADPEDGSGRCGSPGETESPVPSNGEEAGRRADDGHGGDGRRGIEQRI